ncbi:MAG TPA: hypothetical protein VNP04_28660 [Alphaproteobacteria bacterium]|nr:hypothetical protein [Alphaproteobacteria bacterium]
MSLQESLNAVTATGHLMMDLLTFASQWEWNVIGQHTRDALQHLKTQGSDTAIQSMTIPKWSPSCINYDRLAQ